MSTPLRIGILGAARIVPMALTNPARQVPEVQVVSLAARDLDRAAVFARKHGIPRVHKTYDDLIADPEIDAIYNPLPNSLHAEWTIKALRAGKHVLCEKPFASNAEEAEAMAQAAAETGRVLSEAFAYRYHPLTAWLKEVLASGELGTLQTMEARFGFLLPEPRNIRYRYELAGGALMDAGCYPVSLVRHLMGAEPEVLRASARQLRPQVDTRIEADLRFPNGVMAHIACDFLSPRLFESYLRIQGTAGELRVFIPYHPHWFHWVTLRTPQRVWRGRVKGEDAYVLQLRAFVEAIRTGRELSTGPQDGVGNMRVIDAIYARAGLQPRGR